VKVFGLNGESWESVGEEKEGLGSFGFSVALDRGGDILLSGNPLIEFVEASTEDLFHLSCNKSSKSNKSPKSVKGIFTKSPKSTKIISSKSPKTVKSASTKSSKSVKSASTKSSKSTKFGYDEFNQHTVPKSSKSTKGDHHTDKFAFNDSKSPKSEEVKPITEDIEITETKIKAIKSPKIHTISNDTQNNANPSKTSKSQKSTKSIKSPKFEKGSKSGTKSTKSTKSSKGSESKSSKSTKSGKRRNRNLAEINEQLSYVQVYKLEQILIAPSDSPSITPTSHHPSLRPSSYPSLRPSNPPSVQPSRDSTAQPSRDSTSQPSRDSTAYPSESPSADPSTTPTDVPSIEPTSKLSSAKSTGSSTSNTPITIPKSSPTSEPTRGPTNYIGLSAVVFFFAASLLVFSNRRRGTQPLYGDMNVASDLVVVNDGSSLDGRFDAYLSHNWGIDCDARNNHERVNKINEALKKIGIRTRFYEDQFDENGIDMAKEEIDRSMVMIVFVSEKYIANVTGKGDHGEDDQCKQEFEYALKQKGALNMIPVVMEESCIDSLTWGGVVGDRLANHPRHLFYGDRMLDDCVRELSHDIMERIQLEGDVGEDDGSMRSILLEQGSI